jgi:3-phosphoshikimate 1-carboxyvinyltransferase
MSKEKVKLLPYSGTATLAGSKSILQRYLFLASLQKTKTALTPGSVCEDVLEMAEALISLGVDVSVSEKEISIDSNRIDFTKETDVCFRGSATALRFWLARAVAVKATSIVHLSEQLYGRPLKPFLEMLEQMGCRVSLSESWNTDFPYRLEIAPPDKLPKAIETDAVISSQFISGLMMAGSAFGDVLNLRFRQKPVSYTYLQLTEHILNQCSINTHLTETSCMTGGRKNIELKLRIQIEPELAAGAFLMALGTWSDTGVGFHYAGRECFQPDWEMASILKAMGAKPLRQKGVQGFCSSTLHGTEYNMENYPDLVPLVAILALFADSPTTLSGIRRLHYKESDRLQGIITAFNQIGVKYISGNGTLVIFPYENEPEPVILDTQSDHRLVIAFTLLTLHFPQLALSETDSVAKSCPGFFELLESLKEA